MPRPPRCRWVGRLPAADYFKPRGIPLSLLEEVVLTIDEIEALRLADFDGQYQEEAAERMRISRQTFGRIIESARRKVASALVEGKALRIEGGVFKVNNMRTFACAGCGHSWQLAYGTGRPSECPKCHAKNFHRVGGAPGARTLRVRPWPGLRPAGWREARSGRRPSLDGGEKGC